jgi:hypothetical protein
MNEDAIYRKLVETKLDSIQLDPFGYCNNACWFCPRGYIPNPRVYRKHMPLDLMEHIIKQFVDGKGTICVDNFWHIWTGHYNEIILYRHFGGFLDLLKKYKLCTTVLSNCLNFNDTNIRQICDGVDAGVIVGICLNVPAGEPGAFQRYTGQPVSKFQSMVDGTQKLLNSLPVEFTDRNVVSVVVNGVDDDSPDQRKMLGPNAPHIPADDHNKQFRLLTDLFPRAHVYKSGGLLDRGGHLTRLGAFSHSNLYARMDEDVIGCHNCGDIGGRPFAWAHINSIGELFLCCVDYSFEYTFGSLATTPLAELWYSRDHVKMLMKAFDGICRTCCSAIKENRNG